VSKLLAIPAFECARHLCVPVSGKGLPAGSEGEEGIEIPSLLRGTPRTPQLLASASISVDQGFETAGDLVDFTLKAVPLFLPFSGTLLSLPPSFLFSLLCLRGCLAASDFLLALRQDADTFDQLLDSDEVLRRLVPVPGF